MNNDSDSSLWSEKNVLRPRVEWALNIKNESKPYPFYNESKLYPFYNESKPYPFYDESKPYPFYPIMQLSEILWTTQILVSGLCSMELSPDFAPSFQLYISL